MTIFEEGKPEQLFTAPDQRAQPIQGMWELSKVLEIYESRAPRVTVEIGSWDGGTLDQWLKRCPDNATVINIDMIGDSNYNPNNLSLVDEWRKWPRPDTNYQFIGGDSQSDETLKTLRKTLGRKKIDWLFIDGDHSYQGVRGDFEKYLPLCSKTGVIMLHDINPTPSEPHIEVKKFWDELEVLYPSLTLEGYRSHPEQKRWGIGLVYLGQ